MRCSLDCKVNIFEAYMYEEKLASSGLKRLPLVALTDLFVWKREASSAVMVTEKGVAGREGGGIVF